MAVCEYVCVVVAMRAKHGSMRRSECEGVLEGSENTSLEEVFISAQLIQEA